MINLSPMLLCDFYKISHRNMYPKGTQTIYSTWTPRASLKEGINEVVCVGLQPFIMDYLIDFFNKNFFERPLESVLQEYIKVIKNTIGGPVEVGHIKELHSVGFLPLEISGLPEGTIVPIRTPMISIHNTDPRFFWLTNFIESLASCCLWQMSTSATIAKQYKDLLEHFAMETVGNKDFVPFQGHDFSFRGMSSLSSAISSGMGHLLSFAGTDTIPAISAMEYYYKADISKELVGTSIPATEHSVQCTYGNDLEYFTEIITKVHPTGMVSIVADGYDYWDVLKTTLPKLKNIIMSRDGKVVIRPDSGDPVKIICGDPDAPKGSLEHKGSIETLWDLFGGTITDKGFKLLDPHIGLIYGDSITFDRANRIVSILKNKGFASINVVFGIGSFTYQFNTRDTFGFALKSTLAVINGVEIPIFKDPKTEDGTKKSQKGCVGVFVNALGEIVWEDGLTLANISPNIYDHNIMQLKFKNGKMFNVESFTTIKQRLAKLT